MINRLKRDNKIMCYRNFKKDLIKSLKLYKKSLSDIKNEQYKIKSDTIKDVFYMIHMAERYHRVVDFKFYNNGSKLYEGRNKDE